MRSLKRYYISISNAENEYLKRSDRRPGKQVFAHVEYQKSTGRLLEPPGIVFDASVW